MKVPKIKVRVFLSGGLKEYYPTLAQEQMITLKEPLTLLELIERIEINPKIILGAEIHGKLEGKEYLIEEDTELLLLSPMAGG